jgi:hypothetical protein
MKYIDENPINLNNSRDMKKYHLIAIALLIFMAVPCTLHAKGPQQINLGPTGLTGTVSKKTISVTKVAKSSPAEGLIKIKNKIIGAGSANFKKDPRRELAAAINRAETKEEGGQLTLILKDNKKVRLQLKVLGSYRDTAPYNCPKSDVIITNAAEALIRSGQVDHGVTHSALLGLMSTGEKKYIDIAATAIQKAKWAQPDTKAIDDLLAGGRDMGYVGWYWGYNLITLGEYHLLTGDKSVLPAIKIFSVALSRGQDASGAWGHRMISPKRHGRAPGYGTMNQPSLSSFMGLLFAKKCGISDPTLDKAIEKSKLYFESYIGKGAFPYSIGFANTATFNNNGTSGSAAINMSLLNNPHGAAFFSKLSATSYDGLEKGHASTFFNPLWTPLGANLAGPEVNKLFFKKSLWLQTLYRSWDGSFCRFDRNGKEGPQAGVALLSYTLPRKALIITGKEADESIFLTNLAARDVIGMGAIDYKNLPVKELMALAQDHAIPQVRRGAMGSLVQRRKELLPTWIKYLKEGTSQQKDLAISQYGWWIPMADRMPQMEDIGTILRDQNEDSEVRIAAAGSIAHFGEPAKKFYPDIVTLLALDRPEDTFGHLDGSLGKYLSTLSQTPFADGLVRDKDLHIKSAIKLCQHKQQNSRAAGLTMLSDIPLADFPKVADVVMHIIEDKDPTYHTYSNPGGPINAGITILANLNIREGMQCVLDVLDNPSGKWGFKVRFFYNTLPKYGGNAKDTLKTLLADPRTKGLDKGRFRGGWNKMIQTIETDKNPPALISFKKAKTGK